MTDLTTRAAALLAATDKMTPGPYATYPDALHFDSMTLIGTPASAELAIMDAASEDDAAGIVALHNDAPTLIRELLAENERLRKATLDSLHQSDHEDLRDAGPSPFQGRTTRRDEDDDKEYNLMMSHYEGRN